MKRKYKKNYKEIKNHKKKNMKRQICQLPKTRLKIIKKKFFKKNQISKIKKSLKYKTPKKYTKKTI